MNLQHTLAFLALVLATTVPAWSRGGDEEEEKVVNEERTVGKDEKMTYFLIRAEGKPKPPREGFGLLVILPGGSGGKGFNGFCQNIYRHALTEEYLAVQLVAPKWSPDQADRLVWPTKKNPWHGMKFTTEEFVEKVVADVRKEFRLNPAHIFTLGWSSGGPPCYAVSLTENSSVTGSYIAQSVFKPGTMPSLRRARGHAYFIDHSPEDKICKFSDAERAVKNLKKAGARVKLSTYEGGHGWLGPVYPRMRSGIKFLEDNHRPVRRRRR